MCQEPGFIVSEREVAIKLRMGMVACALCLTAGVAHAVTVPSLTVSPPNPTPADSIKLMVTTIDYQGCWDVSAPTCAGLAADTLSTTVAVHYVCTTLFPDLSHRYDWTCALAPLPPGTYVAEYTELHVDSWDPTLTQSLVVPFTVGAATPTLRRSWGALKTVYR